MHVLDAVAEDDKTAFLLGEDVVKIGVFVVRREGDDALMALFAALPVERLLRNELHADALLARHRKDAPQRALRAALQQDLFDRLIRLQKF